MGRRIWLVLMFSQLLWGLPHVQANVRKLIRVDLENQPKETVLALMKLHPDVVSYGEKGLRWEILTDAEQWQRIKTLGLPSQVLIEDADAYEQELRRQGYFDRFHRYDQMLQELRQVEANHPDIAKLYDIGDSWEKTAGIADRDIWAMKISDNVELEEAREPEVLYIGCHHAREIITPEIVLYFIHYLVDKYGTDSTVTYIVDNRELWLVPMMNPDGHEYVFTVDMWWRKNRRDNGDGTYGVDLNRNYGYKWAYDDLGSSPITSDATYRGTAPFSEPETQAIRDLVESHHFSISLSYHSYGQLLLFPWGYVRRPTPDHQTFLAMAQRMVAYNGYRPQMGSELYLVNGDSDDWFYGEQRTKNKIFAFTPEVGRQFHPDTTEIMSLILENLGPNLYAALAAEQYSPLLQISHQPLKDTEDVQGPYTVRAVIRSPVIPVDSTAVFVHYNTTGVSPFDSIALAPTTNPDEFEAHIPGMGDQIRIYYYLSARDEIGRQVSAPRGAPDSLYTFFVGADTLAPTIVHAPVETRCLYMAPFRITATVTDNLGIADVYLYYRRPGESFQMTSMHATSHPDEFVGYIQIADLDTGDVVEYFLMAVDASTRQNSTVFPDTGVFRFTVRWDVLYSFEESNGGFQTRGKAWEWGIPYTGPRSAHSGIKVWATRLQDNYPNRDRSSLISPPIDLRNFPHATLSFYHYFMFERDITRNWDGGNVKVSSDSGLTWKLLIPQGGYPSSHVVALGEPGFSGYQPWWEEVRFDLGDYVGKEILIRFDFASDEAVNFAGWYIDDVNIRPESLTPVESAAEGAPVPETFALFQNYPNPFNPQTIIRYDLPQDCPVKLTIYNLRGQVVRRLVDSRQKAGVHRIPWDGRDDQGKELPSGVYFCKIQAGSFSSTRKMMLLR